MDVFHSYNQKKVANNNVNFKSEKTETQQVKHKDIYATMPIRALGYTNELGEAIRPLSPILANLSWLPAIGYISADIADKYCRDEYSNKQPSKRRASKEFTTQMLASVFLPTCAVKVGQSIVNNAAFLTKTGLDLNQREQISDTILESMKAGEHKNFLDNNGKIDSNAYKESLSVKFDEILKHKKTHKNLNKPIETVVEYIKKPFMKKPKPENIKNYASVVVDRLLDAREKLLDMQKPEKMSEKSFDKFVEITKNMASSEKQSVAFDTIRTMEKRKMFNNRILKSVGGLLSLAVMAKPIDKFVEKTVVDKYVGPQIENFTSFYYQQLEEQKSKRLKNKTADVAETQDINAEPVDNNAESDNQS